MNPPTFQRSPGRNEKPTNAGGADFSPDGRMLCWNSGETGAIYFFDVALREKTAEVSLNTEVGGRTPNFLAAHGGALFVSNGNNDIIERIDLAKNRIVAKQRLMPSPLVARLRGVGPSGMAVSPDGKGPAPGGKINQSALIWVHGMKKLQVLTSRVFADTQMRCALGVISNRVV